MNYRMNCNSFGNSWSVPSTTVLSKNLSETQLYTSLSKGVEGNFDGFFFLLQFKFESRVELWLEMREGLELHYF